MDTIANTDQPTPTDPVALLVVHGIGSQQPGGTIASLVDGLRGVHGPAMQVAWLTDTHATLDGLGRPVHLIEVYWADLLGGDLVRGTFDFDRVFRTVWFPLLNYRTGCLTASGYSRGHVVVRTIVLATLVPLLYAGFMGARFVNQIVEQTFRRDRGDAEAAEATTGGFWRRYGQVARSRADEAAQAYVLLDGVMDQVVGDVFNFVMGAARAFADDTEQTRNITANTEVIQRRVGEAAAEAVAHGCREVQVLSHSLGTLVAFLAMSPPTEPVADLQAPARLTRMVTIGSPLEKVRFFWARLVQRDHAGPVIVHDGSVVAAPATDGDTVALPWTNFYAGSDLVSGRLRPFVGWPAPVNAKTIGLGGLISSHVAYHGNPEFLAILSEQLTGRRPASPPPPPGVGRRFRAIAENLALPALLLLASLVGLLVYVFLGLFTGWVITRPLAWLGLQNVAEWVIWSFVGLILFAMLVGGVFSGYVAARELHARFWAPSRDWQVR